ncbi:MAG: hypothetical protein KA401_00650 [Anaerolineae bacterium]|nr:hypothetical protein [Anaerolineae bacterium]
MRLLSMGGHSYAYDGDGSRVAQTVGALTLRYTLDVQPGLTTVLAETTGAIITRYIHGPTGIHAQQNADGGWRWLLQDGLQSVRAVANSTDIIAAQQYSPYGVPFAPLPETDFGFTGEMTDDNDLVYLRARYLIPGIGVFASRDWWEGCDSKSPTWNGYSWVEGNTINRTDPSGAISISTVVGGASDTPGVGALALVSMLRRTGCNKSSFGVKGVETRGGAEGMSGGAAAEKYSRYPGYEPHDIPVSNRLKDYYQQAGVWEKDGGGGGGWGNAIAMAAALMAGALMGQAYASSQSDPGFSGNVTSDQPKFQGVTIHEAKKSGIRIPWLQPQPGPQPRDIQEDKIAEGNYAESQDSSGECMKCRFGQIINPTFCQVNVDQRSTHAGKKGDHFHILKYDQNPETCSCHLSITDTLFLANPYQGPRGVGPFYPGMALNPELDICNAGWSAP